jgi:hypothetical protein
MVSAKKGARLRPKRKKQRPCAKQERLDGRRHGGLGIARAGTSCHLALREKELLD